LKKQIYIALFVCFICISSGVQAFVPALAFEAWMDRLRADALKQGISKEIVAAALTDDLKPIKSIVKLDRKQPEKTITFNQYRKNIVSRARVNKGRKMFKRHRAELQKIGDAFGVQPRFIVALWGIETNYGGYTGGFGIVPALVTMSYDGRRSAFFRKELMDALRILDQGHISLANMKGSWAGAMGQSQFMPSSFLRYAVDYNGDGRRDIWNTKVDVFASAANYLAQSGWKGDETWGRAVKLPKNFKNKFTGLKVQKTLAEWQKLGVRKINGMDLPVVAGMKGSIVQPDGVGGSAYLVYNNYRTIMRWNKSLYFATSVGLLADQIAMGK